MAKKKSYVWAKSLKKSTYVNSVAISDDGGKVVTGNFFHSYNGSKKSAQNKYGTYCFDKSGTLIFKDIFSAYEGIYWTAISGDGQYAASGGLLSQTPYKGFIKLYNTKKSNKKNSNKAPIFECPTGSRVNKVTLTTDGTSLLAASDKLYFISKNKSGNYSLLQSIKPSKKDGRFVTSEMSANGKYAVACDEQGIVSLYQFNGKKLVGKAKWQLPGAQYSNCVQMTRNGEGFVVGGHQGIVYAFNVRKFITQNKPNWQHQAESHGTVYGAYISEDGKYVSTLSNGYAKDRNAGEVILLEVAKNKATQKWIFPTKRNPNSTTMDANAKYVTVADGHPDGYPGDFYLIDRETGKQIWRYGTDNMSWPMQISQDGTGVAAGSDDSFVYYFTTQK